MTSERGGQPSIGERYGEGAKRTIVVLPDSQREFLTDKYGRISQGIRALIDVDMGREVDAPAVFTALQVSEVLRRVANAMKRGESFESVMSKLD